MLITVSLRLHHFLLIGASIIFITILIIGGEDSAVSNGLDSRGSILETRIEEGQLSFVDPEEVHADADADADVNVDVDVVSQQGAGGDDVQEDIEADVDVPDSPPPTPDPTFQPTPEPTLQPTPEPTSTSTEQATSAPSPEPAPLPTLRPSQAQAQASPAPSETVSVSTSTIPPTSIHAQLTENDAYTPVPAADAEDVDVDVDDILPPPKQPPYLNATEIALLETFNPELAPILPDIVPDQNNPIAVRILMMKPKKYKHRGGTERYQWLIRGEFVNLVLDGLERSPYFTPLQPSIIAEGEPIDWLDEEQVSRNEIWIVDPMPFVSGRRPFTVEGHIMGALGARQAQQHNQSSSAWTKIVYIDYYDHAAGADPTCDNMWLNLIKLAGVGNVRKAVTKVVVGRDWVAQDRWVTPGTIWENRDFTCLGYPTLRTPYAVRSDYMESVLDLYPRFLPEGADETALTPVDTVRPIDAWHHWDVGAGKQDSEIRNFYASLRAVVSIEVMGLNGTMLGDRQLVTFGETTSKGGFTGRLNVGHEYLESLLTTKIIVVAQRDLWEEHYRLMEAFTGGAMVMTDLMLSLPDGLVDGENVVVYRSREHLNQLLRYYLHPKQDKLRLEIARKGYEEVIARHRTYHRMESLFFGKPLSGLNLPSNHLWSRYR